MTPWYRTVPAAIEQLIYVCLWTLVEGKAIAFPLGHSLQSRVFLQVEKQFMGYLPPTP